MPYRDRRPATLAAALLVLTVIAAPGIAAAQTPPPTTDDTVTTDRLPVPNDRRGENEAGPPPPPPENDGPPPVRQDDPPPPTASYYVVIDGQRQGPLDEAGIIALIKSGKLEVDTKVWTKGMADWQQAGSVQDVAALIAAHAPPPPPPPEESFYVAAGGQRTGPFTLKQIEERIAKSEFTAETQVWQRGMAGWTRAGDIPALAELLKKGPPPKAKDASPFVAGRWTVGPVQVPAPVHGAEPGTLRMSVEYAPNGSFSATINIDYLFGTLKVPLRLEVVTLGTYKAAYKSDDTISIVINGKATKTTYNLYNGKADKSLEETISNSALDWKIVDQNTLDDGSGTLLKRIVE